MHYCVTSQRMCQLRGQRKTCHMTSTYSCVTSRRTQRKHSFPYFCVAVFRVWPRDDVFLLLLVGICLRSCGLAMGVQVTIWRNDASLTLCSLRSQLISKSPHHMYGIVPSWKSDRELAQQEIPRQFVEPKRCIVVFTKAQICPVSWVKLIKCTPANPHILFPYRLGYYESTYA
jgi:hypothetical protein